MIPQRKTNRKSRCYYRKGALGEGAGSDAIVKVIVKDCLTCKMCSWNTVNHTSRLLWIPDWKC